MTPPVSFERLTPMPRTRDMSATIGFYTGLLGFSCPSRSDVWATLRRDGAELMIATPNEHLPFTTPKLANFDYGLREFAIYDNNGYLL
jgi:hypothetical protein